VTVIVHLASAGYAQKIISFDATGASLTTAPQAINSAGQIAGLYIDASFVAHGFLRSSCEPDNGSCE
jgi:hypothetical protein